MLSVYLLAGCTSMQPEEMPADTTTNTMPSATVTEATEAPQTVTIKDYSVVGMQNVTEVYFADERKADWGNVMTFVKTEPEEATQIFVKTMCPYCHEQTFFGIEFSKFPKTSIGQPSFAWSEEIACSNGYSHTDNFDYSYSIMFTLNQ